MCALRRNLEMDRPTHNTLTYLTRVAPHRIRKDPWIIDKFVQECLAELMESNTVIEFGEYTRSFYTLEGHYYNIWKYDIPIVGKPDDPVLELAIQNTTDHFRLQTKVDAISWHDLKSVPFIPSSSAGWGYDGKKGDPGNHERAINRAVSSLYWWLETINGQTVRPFRYRPDLAWTRTQLGTFEAPKIRHVWGEAFENVILEGIVASPLIKAYQQIGYPMPIGINMYKRLPSIIQRTLADENEIRYGVGLDIKSFDTAVQPWLIRTAFDILTQNVNFAEPEQVQALAYSIEHFINRPVVMPDGRMWLKRVGVPSGSYFTQLVDSVVNHIIISYAQLKIYNRVFQTYVLGDDSLFGIPVELGYPDLDAFATHLSTLGFTLSTQKCIIATRPDELEFLGHVAKGTRVSRETADMMRLALYPEYPVTGPAVSMTRIKGLVVDSGLTNWPVYHLCTYMENKYRQLGYTPTDRFPPDDANWLNAVVAIPYSPNSLDMVKVWTIT